MVDEKYKEIAELVDEITRCGRCGFCQSVCPVYQVSADECGVARGRNMYAKELISGGLDLTSDNEAFFSECLLCRACVDTCFSAVKTDEIALAGRRLRLRINGVAPARKHLFEKLLPDHKRLGRLIRIAAMGRTTGIGKLAPALRIFGWFGQSVNRAEQFSREIPKKFLREKLANREMSRKGTKQATIFIGCGVNFMFPQVGEATVAVLEALDYNVKVAEHGCCGLPAHAHGAIEAAQHLASNNMQAFADESDGPIITDCSSCASFLKEYPNIFVGDKAKQREAERFASRVLDVTEVLADEGRESMLNKLEDVEIACRATFHDPCHLSRYQRLSEKAREVLHSMPGVRFIEMKEADWCCGAAGAFAIEHPELSLGVLNRKMAHIEASHADTLVTTCPSCLMQIRSGLARKDHSIRCIHLVELMRQLL